MSFMDTTKSQSYINVSDMLDIYDSQSYINRFDVLDVIRRNKRE